MEKSAETAMVFYSGCGNAAKSKTVKNRSSVYSKESEYQFSVKLVNFYFPLRKIR